MTPRDKLAAGRIRTFDYAPYLASYIYSLKQNESKGSATCGVSRDGVIHWDPAFVDELDADSLAYVILHEALHLIFRHHARSAEVYGDNPSQFQQFVMNVAGDLVIEQTMAFMRHLRPPSAVHLGAFAPQLGIFLAFPENLDMIEYYKLIMNAVPRPDGNGGGGNRKQGDAGGGDDQADSDGGGGSSSRVSDSRPQSSSGKKGSQTKPNGKAAACAPGSGGSACDNRKREYEKPDDSWDSYKESLTAKKLEESIAKFEESHPGSVPGKLREAIGHFLRPQRDPWQHLKSAVASSTASPLGGRMATYRRLSRKQPPDVCRLRGQLTTQASAVVIVDTSGSMGDRETKEQALQVIADGLKKLKSVKVVCADTHVRNSIKLADIKNFQWEGGGGTDMARALEEVDKSDHPDSIVLITDAMTGWPDRQTRAKVIVALTCDSSYRDSIPAWCKTIPLF
jgi:predicted metal-dependent peptidase